MVKDINRLGKKIARIDRSYDESRMRNNEFQITGDEFVIHEVDDANENT